jgi:trehalose 6-phosphate phosphatase
LLDKLGGMPVQRVFGNHGAEGEGTGSKRRPDLQRWKAAIEVDLGRAPGVWVEDKGLSLAVHYRQSPQKAEIRRQILRTTRKIERARVYGGKYVVNVVVDGDPHKGTALLAERDRLRCDSVLYVGDDQNDEDAFAIGGNIVSVRIGRTKRSRADFYLRSQEEMDTLLQQLVALRERSLAQ